MPRSARAPVELQAAAELEMRRRKRAALEEAVANQGYQKPGCIPEGMTFREWCNQLAAGGMEVDGIPFTLDDRPSMHFIYDLVPSTREQAYGGLVVMMKCSQVGFTVMEMLAAIYLGLRFPPLKIGMYLPDRNLAGAKSSIRFLPIVRTVPDAYALLTTDNATGKRRSGGEGNVLIREMGKSRFHFLWTSGKATTESFPMDVLSFDEVQEMEVADMEKTRKRLGASRFKWTLMGSTANWPDRDIHFWFKKGTRHRFHTLCPCCGDSFVFDDHFPKVVGYDEERRDYRYRCPLDGCGAWIDDPQLGDWIPEDPELWEEIQRNPAAGIVSLHYPQFLSPTISPRELYKEFLEADDLKGFWNRVIGKPYTDPSQVPVTMEHLWACAAAGAEAGLEWRPSHPGPTFMGVDQMGQFNVAWIKERLPDGRQALVHAEYIYDDDPFARCSELIHLYGVEKCCVEINPNYNDAKRFAQRHNFPVDDEGRRVDRTATVYLVNYGDISDEMMRWGDDSTKTDRKISEEDRDRFTVLIDQYKCMQVALKRITNRQLLFPDPTALTQEVVRKGMREVVPVLKELAFLHFTRTALVAEKDPEQKKYRRKVVKVGIDPHTSYANMLCDVAWAKSHGTSVMMLPDAVKPGSAPGVPSGAAEKLAAKLPGIDPGVLAMVEDLPEGVCGRCASYEAIDENKGTCASRGLNTGRREPSCPLYARRAAKAAA